jgi:hypothetical protein
MDQKKKKEIECEPPFWVDPTILYSDFNLQYVSECEHQVWNFIVRLIFIAIIIGAIGSAFAGLNAFIVSSLFAVITAFVIITTSFYGKKGGSIGRQHKWGKYRELPFEEVVQPHITVANNKSLRKATTSDPVPYLAPMKEGFKNPIQSNEVGAVIGIEEVDGYAYTGPSLPDYTPPTARNPFMNVLLEEYKYNPQRPEAAPVNDPVVKQTMDDYFRVQWFSDPTDVFGKNQSQRQYITQPSTSIPNDRDSYQNWLYKIPGRTCKEGGREACLPGTDGSPVTWLNQDS